MFFIFSLVLLVIFDFETTNTQRGLSKSIVLFSFTSHRAMIFHYSLFSPSLQIHTSRSFFSLFSLSLFLSIYTFFHSLSLALSLFVSFFSKSFLCFCIVHLSIINRPYNHIYLFSLHSYCLIQIGAFFPLLFFVYLFSLYLTISFIF